MPWRMCFWSEKWPPNVKSDLTAGGVRGMLKLGAALYACAATITERRRRERATALRRPVEQNRDFVGGGVTRPRPGGPLGDSYAAHGPPGRSRAAGRSRTIAGGAAGEAPFCVRQRLNKIKILFNLMEAKSVFFAFKLFPVDGTSRCALRWFMRYFARQFLFPEITAIQCHAQQILCNRL